MPFIINCIQIVMLLVLAIKDCTSELLLSNKRQNSTRVHLHYSTRLTSQNCDKPNFIGLMQIRKSNTCVFFLQFFDSRFTVTYRFKEKANQEPTDQEPQWEPRRKFLSLEWTRGLMKG
jgi:hypothetical protein